MKKIIVVQSIPYVLEMVRELLGTIFPQLSALISYQSNFEETLKIIPRDEELTVIASDFYYDSEDVVFVNREKDGSRLAEEIKKINPSAKVYIFSTSAPRPDYIDGFYEKGRGGDDTLKDIVNIFYDLKLAE